MVINALNSGSTQFMADFEDSNAPTWANNIDGHVNLRDANRRTISFQAPNGKTYRSAASTAIPRLTMQSVKQLVPQLVMQLGDSQLAMQVGMQVVTRSQQLTQ
eukprot:GHUV01054995.1.p2 GENE.GHUV01054995.1~~GHUV01054995.1.p2  ORF type:complete len:103 (-),score=18.79 GHUV01054995.1:442-750(-)